MDLGRKTKLGNTKWTGSTVVNVLRNERHCGDVLQEKLLHLITWIINQRKITMIGTNIDRPITMKLL